MLYLYSYKRNFINLCQNFSQHAKLRNPILINTIKLVVNYLYLTELFPNSLWKKILINRWFLPLFRTPVTTLRTLVIIYWGQCHQWPWHNTNPLTSTIYMTSVINSLFTSIQSNFYWTLQNTVLRTISTLKTRTFCTYSWSKGSQ